MLPPHGTGQETYFARGTDQDLFVKLGARVELYQAASQHGLAPPVITVGRLEDGTSILVQQRIQGHKPTRRDFQRYLRKFAESIRMVHGSQALQKLLPPRVSIQYCDVGLEMLAEVEQRWQMVEPGLPPPVVEYVNEKIVSLRKCLRQFQGGGLVASTMIPAMPTGWCRMRNGFTCWISNQ